MLRSEVGVQVVEPAARIGGELMVPGDKSIAHRALILAALAEGDSSIRGLPDGEDVSATVACLRSVGVDIRRKGSDAFVHGLGLDSFATPHGHLDCANSGTTMRLLLGVLAGSHVSAALDGDDSLRRRPMERVIEPLRKMGARVHSSEGHAPLFVRGGLLQGRHHTLPVASAQVKSAILLAGLNARGPTTVVEPLPSRDHTERLLIAMGADLRKQGTVVELRPSHRPLQPIDLAIPGDFSSASFWMAAAALRPGWSVTVREVGLNPSRTAFAHLLKRMGAEVDVVITSEGAEPVGIVRVRGRGLRGIELDAADVTAAIDEIPLLLVLASQAEGRTSVEGAGELRVKESDRLAAMAEGLKRIGVPVDERVEGITVHGPSRLRGATVDSSGDHRVAMALAVAGLVADGPTTIEDADCVDVSYPQFFDDLRWLSHE